MKGRKFEMVLSRIGCGLTQLRIEKGFETMKEFAEKHQLPIIQYWRIENGKANITLKTLLTVLAIHGVSLDDFFLFIRENC